MSNLHIETKSGYSIRFEALPEYEPDHSFCSGIYLEDLLHRIATGQLVQFCAKVSAHREGIELAAAYLGNCIYESVEEFYTTLKGDYFDDLAAEAIEEAEAVRASLCVNIAEERV